MFARWEGGKVESGRQFLLEARDCFESWVLRLLGGRGLRGSFGKKFLLRKRDWGGILWAGLSWAGRKGCAGVLRSVVVGSVWGI